MPCIWIKEASSSKGTKFKLDDVSFNLQVSDLKSQLSKFSGIDEKHYGIVYRGLLLKDDQSLESYGVKEDATVYVLYRKQKKEDREEELDVDVEGLKPVLQAATASPVFKDKMDALLKNPETLTNILTLTPSLAQDPVALSILKDSEIFQNIIKNGDVSKLAKEHPSLIQAASHIAAEITKDVDTSSQRISNPEDNDMMDIEPEMLAQAEFMAAQEETYQSERNTGTDNNPQPITSTFLASALQVARANLVSTSTQTASVQSTSTAAPQLPPSAPQPPQISTEFFNEAMASVMTMNAQRNRFAAELQQLRDLGIEDEALSLRALQATNGDVQAACNLIFGGGLQ
ncbi:ubiquitin-like protein 7 isoform X2 [Xenia sp. Carnegie-2017]|uniref:ubiquitin-like protein 7 isoform X2 n=1 Tax=Xenia sp. Carnegie-2017 TaxID=2897299 RepID=UPI001F04CD04|nr:ubiquitin-like protein 7 isoform X2 [Xenia sp. Carnegie-2017]